MDGYTACREERVPNGEIMQESMPYLVLHAYSLDYSFVHCIPHCVAVISCNNTYLVVDIVTPCCNCVL